MRSTNLSPLFPRWTNHLPALVTALLVAGAPAVVFFVDYYFSPKFTDVGYAPLQPVPYSHQLHAGMLGMDCRYCHQNVERGPHATVPATQTCMNCHGTIRTSSPLLEPVRQSAATGEALPWVKVHMLPDYAYFDHSAHVRVGTKGLAGIGCASCHGRIDQMEVVRQVEPLSMRWCLECHRSPEKHLRPISEITNMAYEHDEAVARELLAQDATIQPPTHCSACHR